MALLRVQTKKACCACEKVPRRSCWRDLKSLPASLCVPARVSQLPQHTYVQLRGQLAAHHGSFRFTTATTTLLAVVAACKREADPAASQSTALVGCGGCANVVCRCRLGPAQPSAVVGHDAQPAREQRRLGPRRCAAPRGVSRPQAPAPVATRPSPSDPHRRTRPGGLPAGRRARALPQCPAAAARVSRPSSATTYLRARSLSCPPPPTRARSPSVLSPSCAAS